MDDISQKAPLGGLARKLIQLGLLKEDAAQHASDMAIKQKKEFVSYLVGNQLVDSTQLAVMCAQEFGIPMLDINALDQEVVPKSLINADLVSKHHALPIFRRGNRLFVAISDPTNVKALDEIKYQTNINTEAILVEEHKFNAVIDKVLAAHETAA
ncbi:MAG TPA: type IV-A pilus assembly ATPase PilB, partial [Gammaproteobacteria bacterium]|nr:type IV-A pilus assembly ATPase PilB [Gammaproteobacteria bacterium]